MNIVNAFKDYLLTQKNPPSSVTVKNYLSDIRKFLSWYEQTYSQTFLPEGLTTSTIAAYQIAIQKNIRPSSPAARSAKRYLSSLRRFANYLETSGMITKDPFTQMQTPKVSSDPWLIKEFTGYLFTQRASSLTIKNYTIDIKQFLTWLEQVTKDESEAKTSNLLQKIDNDVLEEYKMRLLHEAKLSPISINRKLSSLRRYIRWLGEKGIIQTFLAVSDFEKPTPTPLVKREPAPEPIEKPLPLTALHSLGYEEPKKEMHYSGFAPIRLAQKTTNIITLGADLLFFNPVAHFTDVVQYHFLKKTPQQIFTPVKDILKLTDSLPKKSKVKTIIPKATSILPPRSANPISAFEAYLRSGKLPAKEGVHNFTKALYAPLKLSTKQMNIKQKLLHHLKYTRPQWYKTYHSYAFVHYLHFAIMLIATVLSGTAVYLTWHEDGRQTEAVLSAQTTAPPRMLSFQGRLLDKTNTPITAVTPLRFAIYNSSTASGAAMLWSEKQEVKPDHNGYFTTTLGQKSRLSQSIFSDNSSLYVGIAINDGDELKPRQQLPNTTYAANAQTLQGLKPITEDPAKTKNVVLALDSSGNLTIGGTASPTFQATGGQFSLSGQSVVLTTNPASNGNITINPDGAGLIDLQKPIVNTSNDNNQSNIPGAVEVADIFSVFATSSSQSALTVSQNGFGDIISGRNNGVDKFRLDSEGNALFAGKLIVNGNTIGTNATTFGIANNNVINLSIGTNASAISLGASSGITTINNSLSVHGTSELKGAVNTFGLLTANAGITVPTGQSLTLSDIASGAIPYINDANELVGDASHFSWNETTNTVNITGSLCLVNGTSDTACSSSDAGTIYASELSIHSAADLAENYVSSQALEPGDLVVPEGKGNAQAIVKATDAYQPQLIGIISTKPGFILNSDATTDATHPHRYPLALQGRVPVKVSTINGSIQAGDELTSSVIPGVAMKATKGGQTIGKALESYANADPFVVGKIMGFVNLSYHAPETTIASDGNLPIATSSAKPQTTNNPFTILSTAFAEAFPSDGPSLKDYITNLVNQLVDDKLAKVNSQKPPIIASQSAQITPAPTASPAAVFTTIPNPLRADTNLFSASPSAFIYNSIDASPSATATIAATLLASSSAETASVSGTATAEASLQAKDTLPTPTTMVQHYSSIASFSGELTYIPNFSSDFATFNQGLIALGPTSMTDASVSDKLIIDNNLQLTKDTINTVGSDLQIQPLRQGNVVFMGGLVAIDTEGNLEVKGDASFVNNVTVKGKLAAGIIAPVPDEDLIFHLADKSDGTASQLTVTNATGSAVVSINQAGDIIASGEGTFSDLASKAFHIIRGVQADTSDTETVAEGSAGKAVINANQLERTIYTNYVTDHSLIYVTTTSDTKGIVPYLARQTAYDKRNGIRGSFTIQIPYAMKQDIEFNWWIVN